VNHEGRQGLKKTTSTFGTSVLLLLTFTMTFSIEGHATQSVPSALLADSATSEGNFSIIWITDTQYLSESHPTYYESLCSWIVDNADSYNVKMVIHTGDIVEDEWNHTHWENANRAMSILADGGIPYCWNAGNHDYNASYWIGNQYTAFNSALMAEKSYWIDEEDEGQNTAVHFENSGWDFLIINLAYQANDAVLAWANNLLDTYPESHAIVATHVYLNNTGGYGGKGKDDSNWPLNFQKTVLETHANVFLTLSAHVYPTSGSRTEVGDRDELMFNRQDKDGGLGAASLRILTFDTTQGLIDVKTFVLYANNFLADDNNLFTLNSSFRNEQAGKEKNVSSDGGEEFPLIPVLIASVVVVAFVLILGSWQLQRRRRTTKV
jgi:hypothetical protein